LFVNDLSVFYRVEQALHAVGSSPSPTTTHRREPQGSLFISYSISFGFDSRARRLLQQSHSSGGLVGGQYYLSNNSELKNSAKVTPRPFAIRSRLTSDVLRLPVSTSAKYVLAIPMPHAKLS